MALLGRQPSGAYFFRACRTSRRMASDRLGKSGCSRRQSSTAARSSGVAIAQASGANVTSRSLHGLILVSNCQPTWAMRFWAFVLAAVIGCAGN